MSTRSRLSKRCWRSRSRRVRVHAGALLLALVACWWMARPAQAQAAPGPGWTAQLSELQHNVSGWVEIVDERTVRLHDFTYDGLGPRVYVTLGAADSNSAFAAGLYLDPVFAVGRAYAGETVDVTLPDGVESFDGYRAVSVWCDEFSVNFGSGLFAPPPRLYLPLLAHVAN